MKHLKLFATLLLAIGGGNALAQTDVTAQYLQNSGFEESSTRFLQINTDRGVEKPLGWNVEWNQSAGNKNGMTFLSESMNQDNVTWTAKSGKAYFGRMRWECSKLYLRQTMKDLRPGKYTLTFSAMAEKGAGFEGDLSVSVAKQTKEINASSQWTDYSLDFEITEGTKYATVEFKGDKTKKDIKFKFGIDEFKLTYDGSSYYETLLNKAQALYDDNKDWAKNVDALQTAITSATGKETVEDKNQAIFALEKAMQSFKDENTVDITTKIINPNFDSNIDGWTCTGSDGTFQRQTSSQVNFNGGFLEAWRNGWNGTYNHKNFDVSQHLSNLPKGEYTIKAAIIAVEQGKKETYDGKDYYKKHGGPYYIDDEHGVWFYGQSGDNTSLTWANTENDEFTTGAGAEYKTATVKVEDGNLTIGFKGIGSEAGGTSMGTYANWIACDNWTLSYFGFDASALKNDLASLKAEAEELLNSKDYAVVGEERTNLSNAKDVNPEETKTALEKAIADLQNAINTFKSVNDRYKTLNDAKDLTETQLPYASAAKYAALTSAKNCEAATSAADADAKANAIVATRRAYVESNGKAEGVEGAVDCTDKLAATKCGDTMPIDTYAELRVNSGDGATDSEGNKTEKYFDTSGSFYGSNNLKAHLTQEATGLASGKYLLTVQARGSSNLKSLVLTAGNASLNLDVQHPSNLYGAGWDDYSLVAEVGNSGSLSIKIEGVTNAKQAWFSFNDFRLVRIGDLEGVTLDETANNTIEAGVAKVTLKRTLVADNWNTLVLPFDVADADAKALFGDDVKIAKYSNSDDVNIVFNTDEEGIKANVPVLIKPTKVADDNTYTFDGVTLVSATPTAEGSAFDFVGSYNGYQLANDEYMLYGDKWWKTEEGDTYKIKAFRAYIKAKTTQAAKSMNLVIDGQTTGLKLNTMTGNVEGETYNLAGQRIVNSYKGIVVKNGKKMIKK